MTGRIHSLEAAQAVQTATTTGMESTNVATTAGLQATQAGTWAVMNAGSVSLIVGMFLGMTIARINR